MATRRSRRSGAPGALPDDRDCSRGAHGRRRSRGCLCPPAVTNHGSIVNRVERLVAEEQEFRRREEADSKSTKNLDQASDDSRRSRSSSIAADLLRSCRAPRGVRARPR